MGITGCVIQHLQVRRQHLWTTCSFQCSVTLTAPCWCSERISSFAVSFMSIASGPVTGHHWKSLSSLHPPFSFTLMRYALSLLFSRLNSPNSQPLLSSTVLRRSLERHNKRWSVWAESGGELIEWLQRGSMSATGVGTKGKLRFLFLPSVLFPASCLWEDNLGFTEQGERGNI